MPKIQISKTLFQTLLGSPIDIAQLEEDLVSAKGELDESEDEGILKIELNDTNRPDLWTTAGLARHLRSYSKIQSTSKFEFLDTPPDPDKKILVDPKLQHIRPYVQGFIIYGKKVDTVILEELIQMQEKLCENFGQKRKGIAIGIYRADILSWPVHYTAVDPNKTSFVPLEFDKELTLNQILELHPKGKEYARLVAGMKLYPFLRDNQQEVLSFPPIINSARIGAVEEGDEELFIEATGTNLEQLMLAINIFAIDCQELGFHVKRINTIYPYPLEGEIQNSFNKDSNGSITLPSPLHFQKELKVNLDEVYTLLGAKLSHTELQEYLTKMNLNAKIGDTTLTVEIPPYRNDFLHGVDIIEDIIIGKGLNNITPQYPSYFTIGRLSPIEVLSRKLIQIMIGLGFQEMIYPYLSSKEDQIYNMYPEEEWEHILSKVVEIQNPISENYEIVRSSVVPNLLYSEHVSANSPYPHNICEIGKTAILDAHQVLESTTFTTLGFLIADKAIGFTQINSIIAAIFYYINIDWSHEAMSDSRFINGRAARIKIKKDDGTSVSVGEFGEIHPRVLENFKITMPCVAGEIQLESLHLS